MPAGDFHREFMRGRVTLIGCPKLDEGDYAEKLTEILRQNDIQSVTVVRMEVPCCGGIEQAVKRALQQSGKLIPWQVVVLLPAVLFYRGKPCVPVNARVSAKNTIENSGR